MSITKRTRITATAILGMALVAGAGIAAEKTPGVTDTEIWIGNTNPYSGPASAYGTIGRTIQLCLRRGVC